VVLVLVLMLVLMLMLMLMLVLMLVLVLVRSIPPQVQIRPQAASPTACLALLLPTLPTTSKAAFCKYFSSVQHGAQSLH
jgi:hypothetical protein